MNTFSREEHFDHTVGLLHRVLSSILAWSQLTRENRASQNLDNIWMGDAPGGAANQRTLRRQAELMIATGEQIIKDLDTPKAPGFIPKEPERTPAEHAEMLAEIDATP